ncbi:hypothetical protein GCM10009681_56600 [Luedemannella helvata]|uniref:Uncharacterized protein n=1 Tax=Luedemannella helvata TaxID=349315 RepID=A0ABN2L899_9ACTN
MDSIAAVGIAPAVVMQRALKHASPKMLGTAQFYGMSSIAMGSAAVHRLLQRHVTQPRWR